LFVLNRYNAKVLEVIDESKLDQVVNEHGSTEYYKVQLIDENSEGIEDEDCTKVVPGDRLK
jgi:hypothetical protein